MKGPFLGLFYLRPVKGHVLSSIDPYLAEDVRVPADHFLRDPFNDPDEIELLPLLG